MGSKIAILILTIPLAMCGAGLTSSFCDPKSGLGPIVTTPEARASLPRDSKNNILAINKYGKANCGWKT